MKKFLTSSLLFLVPLVAAAMASAAAPSKWFQVEGTVNTTPSFMVSVEVDKPDRVYNEGEQMNVFVTAEKECYVYLLYYSGDEAAVLFPNKFQTDNRIPAKTRIAVPGKGADFQFTASAPFGEEVLQVVASMEKLDTFTTKSLTKNAITQVGNQDLKQMVVEVKKQKEEQWAEANIGILTVGKGGKPPSKKGKRLGVCIGISQYDHDRIQDLQVSHLDAERMAKALKDECECDEVALLTNEQATRANIEKLIFEDLPAKTRAGDTVFIFFSCHGGRTSDVNGDEADGFDEYLVPHDGILGKPETMILDDTFARWMQALSGREIAIFMDNCYSGGTSKGIKAVPLPKGSKATIFDGMEVEMRRTKDLGQQNTIVLAACQANQLAWEMPSAQQGSVLTHYVLKSLKDKASDKNGDGKLTVQEAFQYIQNDVESYVKDKFQADQNPIIVDNAQDGIMFQQKPK